MDKEESVAGTEGSKDQQRTAQTPEHTSLVDQTAGPSDLSVLQGHTTPAAATPGSEAQNGSEELTKKLLAGYQGTLDVAEDLPAVVWVRWGDKGLGRFLKVPYLRWFLWYYLTHHIHKSLDTLNRRLHAIAALADDPDTNKADRETVKLYLQSVPPLPHRMLIFGVVIGALLVALPLQSFGNVLHVLPLVGAGIRFDVYYVVRSIEGQGFGDIARATVVLLLALSVVASLLTSPFALKRLLFNLYPPTKERIASTAARDHASSVEGLYILEEQVFRGVGLRRPKEGKWDLLFQTYVLVLLLLLGLYLGLAAFLLAMSWSLIVESPTELPNLVLPEVYWIFYALPAIIFLVAFVVLLKRVVIAWRRRNRPASA